MSWTGTKEKGSDDKLYNAKPRFSDSFEWPHQMIQFALESMQYRFIRHLDSWELNYEEIKKIIA